MYSTTAFPVLLSRLYVFRSAKPRANLKTPLPPTIGNSLSFRNIKFRPNKLRVLPLNFPSVNTKLKSMTRATSFWSENPYSPCPFPTGLDPGSGPTVNGSSAIATNPKNVEEVLVVLASAICTAVGLVPIVTSCKKNWRWSSFSFFRPRDFGDTYSKKLEFSAAVSEEKRRVRVRVMNQMAIESGDCGHVLWTRNDWEI